jgi:hypothetical protein
MGQYGQRNFEKILTQLWVWPLVKDPETVGLNLQDITKQTPH